MGLQHGGAPAARQGQEPTLQGGTFILLYIIINYYIFIILLLQGGRLQEDGEEGQEKGQADSSRRSTHGGGSTALDSTADVDSANRSLYRKLQLNDSAKPTDSLC